MAYEGSTGLSSSQVGEHQVNDEKNMTILEHLEELRNRLIVVLVAVAVATVIAVLFAGSVFQILEGPARSAKPDLTFIYTAPMEMLSTYLKVALFTGIVLATPVIVYEVAAFVAPGLTRQEKRYLLMLMPGVFFALICGLVFAYFVVVPTALRYLLAAEFLAPYADPFIKISDYLEFVTNLLLAIGFSFELPIVVFFLSKIGIVNTKRLSKYRKYAILVAAVVAAVITPTPDPATQMLVAVPLYFLYEIGVLLSRVA